MEAQRRSRHAGDAISVWFLRRLVPERPHGVGCRPRCCRRRVIHRCRSRSLPTAVGRLQPSWVNSLSRRGHADAEARLLRLATLCARQSGVVSRTQLIGIGFDDNDIRRLVRAKELVRIHPGVYVNHTGPLTWDQRSWVAVLACWPAALRGDSARRSAVRQLRESPDDHARIEIVVDARRTVSSTENHRVLRSRRFEDTIDWSALPPRQRAEEWVLDLAADAGPRLAAIAAIADAVGSGRARPDRLRLALADRTRVPHRAFMAAVVDDVAGGTCSVLEHGYLTRVERAHGLPRGERQVTSTLSGGAGPGAAVHDVVYRRFGLIVELDGREFHSGAQQRDLDLDRDLDAALTLGTTVRIGWGQVFDRPCRTAERITELLTQGDWRGSAHSCPRCR
ncbi:type IV toxin-antitoxin system AbiEi family antitoxin domain-containing protein [Nocardioides sp. BGMRC 2183]|nr:type IV toxin-antitoxin system AbiEi family antitoxin domain-containing protein [Nocardioides sp. BGMRC 2183]